MFLNNKNEKESDRTGRDIMVDLILKIALCHSQLKLNYEQLREMLRYNCAVYGISAALYGGSCDIGMM